MNKAKVKIQRLFRYNLKLKISNSFYKGFFFAFLFLGVLGALTAVGFHTADEILGGTFSGKYVFTDSVKLNNAISTCDGTNEGGLKYNDSQLFLCNGTSWNSVSVGGSSSVIGGIDSYTKLMLHLDNNFLDSSENPYAISLNGNPVATVSGKFGVAGFFDGVGDYLSVPDSDDWDFGSGDFTIDFWYYHKDANYGGIVARTGLESYPSWVILSHQEDDSISFTFEAQGVENSWVLGTNLRCGPRDLNQWNHYAIVRSGNTFSCYKNGILNETRTSTAAIHDTTGSLVIGNYDSYYLNGNIDELRISKGIARWTSDFSVPPGPYS